MTSWHGALLPRSISALRRGWGDRLCMAHFAIIVFGMAALIGQDVDAGVLLVLGLAALAFAGCRILRKVHTYVIAAAALLQALSNLIQQRTLHHMLAFYRRASRLAGAPPAVLQSVNSVLGRGGSRKAFTSVYFSRGGLDVHFVTR